MKEWEITFVDQKGECSSLTLASEHCPTVEEAALYIRGRLFPLLAELDLNDFEDRVDYPTAKQLKEKGGVEITGINERP